MVAMGGGRDIPTSEPRAGSSKERELLLCVLPFPQDSAEKILDEIAKEFPHLDIEYVFKAFQFKAEDRAKVEVPEELYKRATYIATLFWLPPKPESIPNIKFIQLCSAGSNHFSSHPIYTDSKIPICTSSGIHGPQIAEWVIMMDLVHHHKYPAMYEAQKKKEWDQKASMDVKDRVGRRVGILGYGSIGRQVARVSKAMGMDVIAYTASPRPTPESRRDEGFIVPGTGDPDGSLPSAWYSGTDKESLHTFLSQKIDLLVVCVPLTPATTHFLSADEFATLHASNPSGTHISNIARGQVIDQSALITALETKQIAGASLDVTDPEPLPADDPLWTAPNCLITPHVSAASTVLAERAIQVLAENLRRKESGRGLVNEVDRERGY